MSPKFIVLWYKLLFPVKKCIMVKALCQLIKSSLILVAEL